ncbi:MAG: hypothetical protein OSA84_05490 [Akkermansiaceae bacterium]|nr:hypothetical protein [Akkermansiaceae bacterium]
MSAENSGAFWFHRSSNGSDFHLEIFVFGVEGFLEIKLSLEADEEISGDAEAELDAQGEVGTDTMMGNGIPDEGGSGV